MSKKKFSLHQLKIIDDAVFRFYVHVDKTNYFNKESLLYELGKIRIKIENKVIKKERKNDEKERR